MNMNPMQLIQAMIQSGNPMQMMQQLFGNNPNFQRAMQMVQGKTPEQMQQTARNLCKERGIDFNQAVKQMSGMGIPLPVEVEETDGK